MAWFNQPKGINSGGACYSDGCRATEFHDKSQFRPNYDGTCQIKSGPTKSGSNRHRIFRLRSGFFGFRKSKDEEASFEDEFSMEGATCELFDIKIYIIPKEGCCAKQDRYELLCNSPVEATALFKKLRQNAQPAHRIALPHRFELLLPNGPHTWWVQPNIAIQCSSGNKSLSKVCDGSWQNSESWQAERGDREQWIVFDLGQPAEVEQFKYFATGNADSPRELVLLSSDRNDTWAKWCLAWQGPGDAKWGWSTPPMSFDARVARYWKLVVKHTFDKQAPLQLLQVNFHLSFEHHERTHDAGGGAEVVKVANLDGEGAAITIDEVYEYMDTNHDGHVELDEFEEFYNTHKEKLTSILGLGASQGAAAEECEAAEQAPSGDELAASAVFPELEQLQQLPVERRSLPDMLRSHSAELLKGVLKTLDCDELFVVFGSRSCERHLLQALPNNLWEGRKARTHVLSTDMHLVSRAAIPRRDMLIILDHSSNVLAEMGSSFMLLVELLQSCLAQHAGEHNLVVACVPQVPTEWDFTYAIQEALSKFPGAVERLRVVPLPILLSPQSASLISMGMPTLWREVALCRGQAAGTMVESVVQALGSVEDLMNSIDIVQAKGDVAVAVAERVLQLRAKRPTASRRCRSIGRMVILDRSVDMLTPCLTECSFRGCLLECFGSLRELSRVVKPALKQRSGGDDSLGALLTWDQNDPIWEQLRDQSFTGACKWLSDTMASYNGMAGGLSKELSTQDIIDLKTEHERVTKLRPWIMAHQEVINVTMKKLRSVQQEGCALMRDLSATGDHGNVSWWDQVLLQPIFLRNRLYEDKRLLVIQSIKERINAGTSLTAVLRMIGIVSMTSNGFLQEDLLLLRRHMVRAYGVQAAAALDNLERLGLLPPPREGGLIQAFGFGETRWEELQRSFRLCIDPDEPDPEGLGAAFQQYVPILVKTVEFAVQDRWKARREPSLSLIAGKSLEARHREALWADAAPTRQSEDGWHDQAVLVVLIGGCSESELGSLQALARREGRKYIVITTSILSGEQLIESFEMDWATCM